MTHIRLSDRAARLHRRRDPRDARACLARGRRFDARRQHAGVRSRAPTRSLQGRDFVIPDDVKTLALPVLRHRADPVAQRRDRGPHGGSHPARNPRPDAGAAMIRPTLRAVRVFAVGVPLALLIVIVDSGALAVVVRLRRSWRCSSIASDCGAGAAAGALLEVEIAHAEPAVYRRARSHSAVDRGRQVSPAGRASSWCASSAARSSLPRSSRGEIPTGAAGAQSRLPIAGAAARARSTSTQIWLRWRGPLALVEFIRRFAVDRTDRRGAERARRARLGAAVLRARGDVRHQGCRSSRARAPSSRRCATTRPGSTAASSTGSIRRGIASCCARSSAPNAIIRSCWRSTPAI